MRALIIFLLTCSLCFAEETTNCWTRYQNCDNTPSYGQIVENNESGTAITLTTAGSWYPWASAQASNGTGSTGHSTITTSTGATSSITIGSQGSGAYTVNYHASIDAPASAVVECAVFKNESRMVNTQTHVKVDAAGRTELTLSAASRTQSTTGDEYTLRFSSDSNGDVIDIFHCYLGVTRIAPLME